VTEPAVPPDTDEYIYRPVTRVNIQPSGEPVVETVMTQIRITQP
jgi:hypothetical protein